MSTSFNDFFFEYLQRGDAMFAEIPSKRKNFRRWAYVYVLRKSFIFRGFVSPVSQAAHGPPYWFMDIFDFDHVTYDFKDYEKDPDCGMTHREYIERLQTADLELFKRKLEEFSLNQDMFTYENWDFPQ